MTPLKELPNDIHDKTDDLRSLIRECLRIDEEGRLVWRVSLTKIKAGDQAGDTNGRLLLGNQVFRAARAAWFLHHGEMPSRRVFQRDGNRRNFARDNLVMLEPGQPHERSKRQANAPATQPEMAPPAPTRSPFYSEMRPQYASIEKPIPIRVVLAALRDFAVGDADEIQTRQLEWLDRFPPDWSDPEHVRAYRAKLCAQLGLPKPEYPWSRDAA